MANLTQVCDSHMGMTNPEKPRQSAILPGHERRNPEKGFCSQTSRAGRAWGLSSSETTSFPTILLIIGWYLKVPYKIYGIKNDQVPTVYQALRYHTRVIDARVHRLGITPAGQT